MFRISNTKTQRINKIKSLSKIMNDFEINKIVTDTLGLDAGSIVIVNMQVTTLVNY